MEQRVRKVSSHESMVDVSLRGPSKVEEFRRSAGSLWAGRPGLAPTSSADTLTHSRIPPCTWREAVASGLVAPLDDAMRPFASKSLLALALVPRTQTQVAHQACEFPSSRRSLPCESALWP
ncbi:hypothetical protein ISCGN_011617 [Ixodes scapularis]